MTTAGNWFPRLSPSGRHVAAGNIDLRAWLDGAPVEEQPTFERPGLMRPVWLDEDTILANAHNGSGIYRVPVRHPGAAERIDPRGANRLTAGKGWWAAWRPDIGIYVSDGTIIADGRLPAIDGPSLAYVRDRMDGTQILMLDQTVIWEGAIIDVWLRDDVLLWRTAANRLLRWTLAVGVEDVTLDPAHGEYWGVPLGGYILSHDHNRLMLRHRGNTRGWIVHEGTTDEPDARLTGHQCRVAWSAGGVAAERTIDLLSPTVDLRRPRPVWHPAGTAVSDTRYLRPTLQGLVKRATDGQTLQEWTIVTTGEIIQIKGGQPHLQERWLVDGPRVSLVYDATDGRYPRAWRLAPDNLWCRRDWRVGDMQEFPDNRLIRRTEGGSSTSEPFPYAVGLEAYGEHIDLGGDCGLCTVVVLWFSPHWPRSGEIEKNWYAIRERDGVSLGRVRFELWKNTRLVVRTDFTQIVSAPSVQPVAPLPIPDPPKEPAMKPPTAWGEFAYPRTISTSAPWEYRAEEPENGIRVTIRGEHDRPTWIEWSAAGRTESRWTAQATRVVAESGPSVPPTPEPPVEPPEPPTDLEAVWPISRVRQVRANFLALPGHGYVFMYPGHYAAKRAAIRATMKAEGLTHLPFGIWGRYPGLPSFDYRGDPAEFRAILDECYTDGICPIVFLHTDRMADEAPKWHEADIVAFWQSYLPQIADRVRAASLFWEGDQIDKDPNRDNSPILSGHMQLRLIAEARRHLTSSTTLYGHWGPERWAGGPDRAGDYTRDEYAWWTDARAAGMTGCLYNDNNADLDAALDRLLRIPAPHGARPGIAGRLAYLGVDCVAFELSRGDYARWQAVRRAVEGHRDVQGWG